jgi:hypothetical protein
MEQEFLDWISLKLNKKVGKLVGWGSEGYVYELGHSSVIKISSRDFSEQERIMNKNIEGLVKVYSWGSISVPKRFLDEWILKVPFLKVKNTYSQMPVRDGKLYYLIMERVTTTDDIYWQLEDLDDLIDDYIMKNERYDSDYTGLRTLYNNRDDMDLIQGIANTISDSKILTTFSELVVIFRNVSKYYNWKDIHKHQFGRNSKGQLVAFDLDDSIRHKGKGKYEIRESIKRFGEFISKPRR